MLRLENISKTFRMGEVDVHVLQNVNLQIAEGDFTTIVGPSGSGKTTLLNILGGIDSPTTGEVWFGEHNLTNYNEEHPVQMQAYNTRSVTPMLRLIW